MVAPRLTSLLAVGLLATSALAAERSASFGVTVQVIAPLSVSVAGVATAQRALVGSPDTLAVWTARLPATASVRGGLPAVLVAADPGGPARPCEPTACRATFRTDAIDAPSAHAVVVTILPDGSPPAILER